MARLTDEQWDDAVTYGSDVRTKCEVVDSTGQFVVRELDITGGSVTKDISRKTYAQCSLTLQDPTGELVPNAARDLLQPYSEYYLRLYRGISVRGVEDLRPLGTFAPYSPRVRDTGDSLEISLTGYDKSKIISRLRWTKPYMILGGTLTTTAIKNLLLDRMPTLKFNIQPSNTTVPLMVLGIEADHDPWDEADKIAKADGMEIFFDENDVVVIRKIPDPETDPVIATFADDERCTVSEFNRENDGDQMYTGVVVRSEGSGVGDPLYAELWRPDTTLRIPYFFTTSIITTAAQMQATAQSLYNRVTRAEYGVEITAAPDARRQAGEVIAIKRDLSRINSTFVSGSVTMPLDEESPMKISTSQRRAA